MLCEVDEGDRGISFGMCCDDDYSESTRGSLQVKFWVSCVFSQYCFYHYLSEITTHLV